MKLILFDLDGTILSTQGAGMRAMGIAGEKLFGPSFHFRELNAAGSLDSHLFAAAARRAGIAADDSNHHVFRRAYRDQLQKELAGDQSIRIMPGVVDLIHQVHRHPDLALGMLTGNYAETAALKLRCAGIDPRMFLVCAFGDEAPDRPAMVPVAMQRHEQIFGRRPQPHHVVIIGDTPRDVHAAHAHGCRCLAVATGPYSREDLQKTGADTVVDSLIDQCPFWKLIHA